MFKRVLIVLITMFLLTTPCFAYQNEFSTILNGFAWGSKLEDIQSSGICLRYDHDEPLFTDYKRDGDKEGTKEAKLDKFTYLFIQGKLYGGVLSYDGYDNTMKVVELFTNSCGEPKKNNNCYIWNGDKYTDLLISYHNETDEGYAIFTSIKIRKVIDDLYKLQR